MHGFRGSEEVVVDAAKCCEAVSCVQLEPEFAEYQPHRPRWLLVGPVAGLSWTPCLLNSETLRDLLQGSTGSIGASPT